MPALMIITGRWYNESEQAPRQALWYCGLGAGQIVGGLLSFGFQHETNAALQSWRLMFVVLGSITTLLGLVTFVFLPDAPSTSKFLSNTEKEMVQQHLSSDRKPDQQHRFDPGQLADTFKDPQIWFLCAMTILVRDPQDVVFLMPEAGAILISIVAKYFIRRHFDLLGYIDQKRWALT